MAAKLIAFAAVLAAAVISTASAATYNVSEPGWFWDLQTNYSDWAASKRFHPGDQIVFKYSPQAHDVVEVSKADYDLCSCWDTSSNARPIVTHTSGNDAIALTSAGMRYFICGIPGHCAGGMKLQVDVVPSATSLAPASAPGTNAPTSPSTPGSAATKATATGFALAGVLIAAGLMA